MEFFLFSYKILTAYLFGYAVFFLFSLFYKNNKLKSFVDFSESKIPSVGLLILFIYLIVIFVEVYEDIGFLGGLKQYRYGFFGDKLFSSFFVYQFLSFAFLILPTQLFRFDKVNKSIFLKLFLILFFLLELNWILEEIESYLNLSGSRVYCSNFYSPYRIVKILIVYIVLNFILIKFFNRNAKPQL